MKWFDQSSIALSGSARGNSLVIGLVNNTSDRALKATERQFLNLLRAAAPDSDLELKLFTCPEIARSVRISDGGDNAYASIADLFDTRLDAVIVTGMEPRARALQDEPIWGTLCKLADWAEDRGVPVIWSCLAAHAAVLHLDGIPRTRLTAKMSGIFHTEAVSDHPLMRGLSHWGSPHSRYHGLPEEPLLATGYEILSRSEEAGADIFLRHRGAPFVFFQGHPEYAANALLHEYKRDVRRYLVGERDEYPAMPRNYFDSGTSAALAAIRHAVLQRGRDPERLAELCALLNDLACPSPWQSAAIRILANWVAGMVRAEPEPCERMYQVPPAYSGETTGELSL